MIGQPKCMGYIPLTNVIKMIALALIHEAMHTCGMLDHDRNWGGPSNPGTNPADDIARGCMGIGGHLPGYQITV